MNELEAPFHMRNDYKKRPRRLLNQLWNKRRDERSLAWKYDCQSPAVTYHPSTALLDSAVAECLMSPSLSVVVGC